MKEFNREDWNELLLLFPKGKSIYNGDRNELRIVDFQSDQVLIKSFKRPNLINQIIYGNFRDSKAKRSYIHGKKIRDLGLGTPEPLGYREFKKGFFFDKSYYACRFIDYDFTLREVLYELGFEEAKPFLALYAELMVGLHRNEMLFIDNTPANFLIKKSDKGAKIYMVDLNRMKFGALSLEQRMKNLAKITNDEARLEYIAEKYAEMMGERDTLVKPLLLKEMRIFQEKLERKDNLKKILKFWKKQ